MPINYNIQTDPKTTARAGVVNARLSWKDSIEMARFIKGMKTAKAKAFLHDVIKKKRALPLPRFNDNRGHKPGKVGPGRYPVNVSRTYLELIESAEKNAGQKGLDEKNLVVKYAFANKGATFNRPRKNELRGQVRKSANISIIVEGKETPNAAKKAEKHAHEAKKEAKAPGQKSGKKAAESKAEKPAAPKSEAKEGPAAEEKLDEKKEQEPEASKKENADVPGEQKENK